MTWGSLGTQFCLELAFGVLLGLALIPRAPLGAFFFRMMGVTAMVPLLGAFLGPPLLGLTGWADGVVIASGLALLGLPLASGPVRASRRAAALWWSTAATAASLVFAVSRAPGISGAGELALGSLCAMATGAVAGGVGMAMVLGHWYLTVPTLSVEWLQRVNKLTAAAMVLCAALVGLSCFVFADNLSDAETPLLGPWGLLYLSARIAVGLAMPLLFAWMTAGSLAYSNTRSATGILYASTVLVLIGAAASISLQDSYGVPL